MWRGFSLAAAFVLTLAACSSGTPKTASSVQTATVGQVASVVAGEQAGIRESAEKAKPCELPDSPVCGIAAQLSLETFSLRLQTLETKLAGVAEPGTELFLGAYPTELVPLVNQTFGAIRDFIAKKGELPEPYSRCFQSSPETGCESKVYAVFFALGHVTQALDSWSPYT